MQTLIKYLEQRFPTITFRGSDVFCWSPEAHEVLYVKSADLPTGTWSLLHETGHALLRHKNYRSDFELLRLEIAAWDKAKELASDLGIDINEDHIQDCLDTYRDWVYARSICPLCGTKCLQQNNLKQYRCFNCHEVWQVTPSRFCRAYRAKKRAKDTPTLGFDALITI